jgi:hypothetical protein
MKNQSFLRFLLAVFAVVTLASCGNVILDRNGCFAGFTPTHVGTFGPGNPYRPLGGVVVASGVVGGFCSPGGMYGGYATRPIPQGYGAVPLFPQGSCVSPGYPGNYYNNQGGFGNPFGNQFGNPNFAAPGQANWCPSPNLIRPGVSPRRYDPYTRRWY